MSVNTFGYSRWNFQFEIDGQTTLDPTKDHKLLRRIAGRRALFMDPLLKSGYLKGKRVLDLGCNSGFWSYLALAEGGAEHVVGIEASPELADQARFVFNKKGIAADRYDIILFDAYEHLRSTKEKYDVILCLGFFYHINDPLLLLRLMHDACRGFVVIDTIIDISPEAVISLRPVQQKSVIDEANITLELVSSTKAIHWMAEEIGFAETRNLYDKYERISSMWDYISGHRAAYVLSKGQPVANIWSQSENPGYLAIQDDLKRYGYFPEMHLPNGRAGRDAELADGIVSGDRERIHGNVGIRTATNLLVRALKRRIFGRQR